MNRSSSGSNLRRSLNLGTTVVPPQIPKKTPVENEDIEDIVDSGTAIDDGFDANQKENITVVIRVRPPVPREIKAAHDRGEPYINTIRISDSKKSMTISDAMDDTSYSVGHAFTFDHIYGEDSRQEDIYENHARGAVLSVLKGYNVSWLFYCFSKQSQ